MKQTRARRLTFLMALMALPIVLAWFIAAKRSWLPVVRRMYAEPVQTLQFSLDGQRITTTARVMEMSGETTFANELASNSLQPLRRVMKAVVQKGHAVYTPDFRLRAAIVPQIKGFSHAIPFYWYRVELRVTRTNALLWQSKTSPTFSETVFSPRSNWAFIQTGEGAFLVSLVTRHKFALKPPSNPAFSAREQGIFSTPSFSSDERYLVVSDYSGHAQLYEVATGRYLRTLRSPRNKKLWNAANCQAAFTPNDHLLAEAYREPCIKVWDIESNQLRHLIVNAATCLAFSPDGHTLASGDINGTLRLWDAQSGAKLRTMALTKSRVLEMPFEITFPAPQSAYAMPTGAIKALAWSPDGSVLVCGDDSGYVTRWRIT